jgi:hypothetical protein
MSDEQNPSIAEPPEGGTFEDLVPRPAVTPQVLPQSLQELVLIDVLRRLTNMEERAAKSETRLAHSEQQVITAHTGLIQVGKFLDDHIGAFDLLLRHLVMRCPEVAQALTNTVESGELHDIDSGAATVLENFWRRLAEVEQPAAAASTTVH